MALKRDARKLADYFGGERDLVTFIVEPNFNDVAGVT
jgi:hypothetical protein